MAAWRRLQFSDRPPRRPSPRRCLRLDRRCQRRGGALDRTRSGRSSNSSASLRGDRHVSVLPEAEADGLGVNDGRKWNPSGRPKVDPRWWVIGRCCWVWRALNDAADLQSAFLDAYRARVTADFPRQPDSTTLFPFPHLFIVARHRWDLNGGAPRRRRRRRADRFLPRQDPARRRVSPRNAVPTCLQASRAFAPTPTR